MILLNRWARLFHFARPSLSAVTSLPALESVMQQKLVKAIEAVNNETLQHYSLPNLIQQKLKIEASPATTVAQRNITLSISNSRNKEHRQVEFRLDQGIKDLKLEPVQFGLPFGQQSMKHFSEERGVPAFEELQEYEVDDKTMLLFNLPDNITKQDIQVMLREKVQKITIKYCVLGLPAYARIQFENNQLLESCRDKMVNNQIDFGERSARAKTHHDFDRLRLANRRLVVHLEEDAHLQKTLVEMSRFGRVMHLDWPIEASMNPNLSEVKEHFKDGRELVKINSIYPDGRVESEYYPDFRVWRGDDEREEENIIDRGQRLKEVYEHRARFARQVNVKIGKQHQLNIQNRGYCVVTFSTSEECQNYYFTNGVGTKLELVGDKLDFEFDPHFRKQVLRLIDSQHLLGQRRVKVVREENKLDQMVGPPRKIQDQSDVDLEQGRSFESYNLLDRLLVHYYYSTEQNRSNLKPNEISEHIEWEDRLRVMKQAKADSGSLTFDQLAEKELYGRVLPKDDKIERLKVEDSKYRVSKEEELIKKYDLITDMQEKRLRDKFYFFQRERNNRLADKALGIEHGQEEQYEEGEGQESQHDGQNIGKHQFSTSRIPHLYRRRTADQQANFQLRFAQFIRGLIHQYMGVFQDKLLQQAAVSKITPLNPQSLTFSDGSPFLTEQEVTQVLQFRRDLSVAQEDYENYIYGNQYIKSSGMDLKDVFGNYKQFQSARLCELADVGVVESLRKMDSQEDEATIQSKIAVLNTEVANFGEQYRQQIIDNKSYLAKIRKIEHLVPIQRIAHLQQVSQELSNDIQPSQASIFTENFSTIKETGIIPDEVCEAFGVQKGLTVQQLLSQMGREHGVTGKDWQMLARLRQYSLDELGDDFSRQNKWQRNRARRRKVGSYDFAKDPSQVYVKDREGYFKVSRYRQI